MDSQRLEELFRYLQATSDAVTSKDYDLDSPLGYQPEHASISTDPVLNGLTQLGACRMNADRAFVSLIDQEHQFVVSEMTTSISLFDSAHHAENHGVCIGVRSLDLYAGICAGTMPAFTSGLPDDRPFINTDNVFANSSRYVINDLSLETKYAARPYVTGYPQMRYYAEVPIKSSSGFVLGTYAVLDNKPRNGMTEEQYRIMHETSMAIMQHLEMIKLREEHNNATRLLQGLSALIQDGPSSSVTNDVQTESAKESEADTVDGDAPDKSTAFPNTNPAPSEQPIPESLEFSKLAEFRNSNIVVTEACHLSIPIEVERSRPDRLQDERKAPLVTELPEEMDITINLAGNGTRESENVSINDELEATETSNTSGRLFTYAANLLRHAMKLEGVMFLDPTPNRVFVHDCPVAEQPGIDGTHSIRQVGHLRTSSESIQKPSKAARPSEEVNGNDRLSQPRASRNFGYSIKNPNQAFSLPESIHQELLQLCSSGKVFNLTKTSHASSPLLQPSDSTDNKVNSRGNPERIQEVEITIRRYIPAARSIMFMPLWNPHTGKWFAGGLGWSTQYKRVLTSSDLSYFAAFGNTLMAEIARLELLAIDRAKSDFISCMSHELRSPLHGILGSTEMLLDSVTNDDQRQYVSMIGKCGHILLETMENILQFSKINQGVSGTRSVHERGKSARKPSDAEARVSGAESDLSLSVLVEETCEVLVAGKSGAIHAKTSNDLQSYGTKILPESSDSAETLSDQPVTVILQADPTCSKYVRTSSAAWRRCLLNLLGNSLKYTETGYVHVELKHLTTSTEPITESSQLMISLIVRDTGRGISREYLESRLFRPFEQENTFSSGTGLGLSIVKSLVDGLDGSVDIQSEIGVGTKVVLSIPVQLAQNSHDLVQTSQSHVGLTICLLGFGTQSYPRRSSIGNSPVTIERNTIIQKALITHCRQLLGITWSCADSVTAVNADIIAILESSLHLLQSELGPGMITVPANCSLLVLCSDHHIHYHSNDHEQKGRVAFVSQPFGPQKLATIIEGFRQFRSTEGSRIEEQVEINLEMLHSDLDSSKMNARTTPPTTPSTPSSKRAKVTHTSSKQIDSMPHISLSQLSTSKSSLKHVLLVDDNSINLKLIVQLIQKLKCTYKVATNGLEALNIYKTSPQHFDFIFMDISMPVMDGFESTRAIRTVENEENRQSTCIVAMTGLGSEDARNTGLASGFSMFWTKPVKLKDIKALIEADNMGQAPKP